MERQEIQNLDQVEPEITAIGEVTERDVLRFAKQILACLFVLATLPFVFLAFNKETGIELLDWAWKVLTPIVTLILGYYFASPKQ